MASVPAVEITGDGSATLRSPLHGDTYHSTRGAVGEARHVFIEAGFREVAGSDSGCCCCSGSGFGSDSGCCSGCDPCFGSRGLTESSGEAEDFRMCLREEIVAGFDAVSDQGMAVDSRVGLGSAALDSQACSGGMAADSGKSMAGSCVPVGGPACPVERSVLGPVRILEMGFGTGLNAWLTLTEAERAEGRGGRWVGRRVEYAAVELYPVPEDVAARLGYTDDARFMAMHRAPWGEWAEVADVFLLLKLHGNMVEMLQAGLPRPDAAATKFSGSRGAGLPDSLGSPGSSDPDGLLRFDLVYWDAFAPDTQPELWTADVFAHIYGAMADGGVLVTYSSKGDVRRALQAAGFAVEKLPGALGKRHMLRARKVVECKSADSDGMKMRDL